MLGSGNRVASFSGVLRHLIAGRSGSAVSPHLSGWPVRRGSRRVVAGLLPLPRTGGLHQRWLTPRHPLAPQFGVGPEVGLVGKECPGSGPCSGSLGLIPPGSVLRHKGLTLGLIRLQQPLLGPLQDESQAVRAVQVVQATAAAQADAKPLRDKPVHHPPVPVGQFQLASSSWPVPVGQFQLASSSWPAPASPAPPPSTPPVASRQGRGEPPLCSNINVLGPLCPKAATHRPMVCGSRSKASAADQRQLMLPACCVKRKCYRNSDPAVGSNRAASDAAVRVWTDWSRPA